MAKLTGKELAAFGQSKAGTPYVYGAKGANGPLTQQHVDWLAKSYPSMFTTAYLEKIRKRNLVGKVCTDCSGLISWYTGKVLGSSQLYSQAYARLPMSKVNDFAIGTVLWKSGHVGIYLGNGLVVAEAKGIDYGTVISKVSDTKWQYGLTFSWIDYEIEKPIESSKITYKGTNPYTTPTIDLKKGSTGQNVKWLQWELIEAGYDVLIDGDFGDKTLAALKSFQQSSKLVVDGICGPITRKALLSSSGNNPFKEPTVDVKLGSSGNNVKWLQWELNQSGASLIVDGKFQEKTLAAVKDFQTRSNIKVDGIVGKQTRKYLKEAM